MSPYNRCLLLQYRYIILFGKRVTHNHKIECGPTRWWHTLHSLQIPLYRKGMSTMSTMSMKYSVAACPVWLTTAAALLITETGCLHEQGQSGVCELSPLGINPLSCSLHLWRWAVCVLLVGMKCTSGSTCFARFSSCSDYVCVRVRCWAAPSAEVWAAVSPLVPFASAWRTKVFSVLARLFTAAARVACYCGTRSAAH